MSSHVIVRAGHANSPSDPFGEEVLDLASTGEFVYTRGLRDEHWRLEGHAERAVVARVFTALKESGFPVVPDHQIPPGSSLVTLGILHKGQRVQVQMDRYKGGAFPGYSVVLAWNTEWTTWLRSPRGLPPKGLSLTQ